MLPSFRLKAETLLYGACRALWKGVWFESSADSSSVVRQAQIEYAQVGIKADRCAVRVEQAEVTLSQKEMESRMELESYFDFVADDAIRIKGTRVGIETVLWDYGLGATPEEIAIRYPALSLQQVYVTITYYLVNRAALDAYMERVRRQGEEAWQEQQQHPSDFMESLRERLERQRQVLRQKTLIDPLVNCKTFIWREL